MKFLCKAILITGFLLFSFSHAFADAIVVSTAGKVEVNRNNQWVQVSANSRISEGEVISTGFNSEAILKYQNSLMKLGPVTRITLEKLVSNDNKDNVSVYLNTGSIRSTVNHSSNKRVSYTVRNPVAVASVRGTDFTFDGTGTVYCMDGGVAVIPALNFDPADLGVVKPADGRNGASDEQVAAAEERQPASGETNAFTESRNIDPAITRGVVVTAGQATSFANPATNMPGRPQSIAVLQNTPPVINTTLASQEAVSFGGVQESSEISALTDDTASKSKSTTLTVIIKIKD